MVIPIFY